MFYLFSRSSQRFSAAPVRWWPWSDATRWRTVPRSHHHRAAAPGGGSFATIRRWAAPDVVATNRPAAGGADRWWATAHNSTPATRDRLSCFCHRPGVPGEVAASRRPRRWWWWPRKSRTRFREGLFVLFYLFHFPTKQRRFQRRLCELPRKHSSIRFRIDCKAIFQSTKSSHVHVGKHSFLKFYSQTNRRDI